MTLVLVMGISGSGKTTFAREFCKTHPSFLYLGADALRARFGTDENDQSVSCTVFEYIEKTAHDHLEVGWDVLIDATLLHSKARKKYIQIARKYGHEVEIYVMDTPWKTSLERNNSRERVVSEEIIRKQLAKYHPPTEGDGEADRIFYVKPIKV
jgi:protein phosphatase